MTARDGGPAFPRLEQDYIAGHGRFVRGSHGGMTLRDWFAGQVAAAGMTNAKGLNTLSEEDLSDSLRYLSEVSYRLADAMLAAREAGA